MNLVLLVFVPFLLAILLGRIMLPYILLITYKKRLFDPVDKRKVHRGIIPRLGGVAFAPIQCCLFVTTLVIAIKIFDMRLEVEAWAILPGFMMMLCGLVILFIVGIADDLVGVHFKWKFLAQILVASFLPFSGLWINDFFGLGFITVLPHWLGSILTVFIVVLVINAVNLIDGLDGLCSGIVGIGCVILGALFMYYSAWIHALFAFITAGLLVPFFYYNVFGTRRRRRQIFMGDTGSMTLGYSMAFLAISFGMNNYFIHPPSQGAIVVAFSTLIVPLLDVARVIYVRWRTGMPIFRPDRNHLHHKFLRAGMSPKSAMIFILFLTLFFCGFNIVMVEIVNINLVIVLDIVVWIIFHRLFNQLERKKFIAKVQVFINLL